MSLTGSIHSGAVFTYILTIGSGSETDLVLGISSRLGAVPDSVSRDPQCHVRLANDGAPAIERVAIEVACEVQLVVIEAREDRRYGKAPFRHMDAACRSITIQRQPAAIDEALIAAVDRTFLDGDDAVPVVHLLAGVLVEADLVDAFVHGFPPGWRDPQDAKPNDTHASAIRTAYGGGGGMAFQGFGPSAIVAGAWRQATSRVAPKPFGTLRGAKNKKATLLRWPFL